MSAFFFFFDQGPQTNLFQVHLQRPNRNQRELQSQNNVQHPH